MFIIAPQKYLEENDEAKKYPYRVSYEEICKYFKEKMDARSCFKLTQLEQAISHQKSGYKIIEVKCVTDFWESYIDYKEKRYKQLELLNSRGPKGARSTWPTYKTVHKDVTVVHKTEKGYVDLSFRGGYERIHSLAALFEETIGDVQELEMTVAAAGKSAVLRKRVPVIDVYETFETYENEIDECFRAIKELNDIALRLDVRKLQQILRD